MTLIEEFERDGVWLFRWRSYLPFVFLPLIAVAVTQYPRIETYPALHYAWGLSCLAISLLGLAIRCHTVGHAAENTSGRNTKRQVADVLNTSGMYSIVRHPLYLGNFLIAFGIVAYSLSPWTALVFTLAFALYYERIMFTEEAFLRREFGELFTEWSSRTPAFIPRFRNWLSAELPMNWLKMFQAESAALAVIAVAFPLLEFATHSTQANTVPVEPSWYVVVSLGMTLYLIARLLKRCAKQVAREKALLGAEAKGL